MAFEYQDDQANEKPDTRLLVDVGSSKTTDLSQRKTDLSASASWAYESPSDRTELSTNREITVQFDADTGSSGSLVYIGSTDDADWHAWMRIAGNKLYCYWRLDGAAATAIFSAIDLPNLGAVLRTYTVQWCTRPNPLTTAASDTQVSELFIIDHDTADSYAIHRAEHSDIAPTPGTTSFSIGMQWYSGSEHTAYTDTIAYVRVGKRFHSTTEGKEDWRAQTSPAALVGESRVEMLRLPQSIGWADDGHFAGKQYAYAAACHRQNALRLLSNIWQLSIEDPEENEDDLADVYDPAWVIDTPGEDGTWQSCLAFYCERKLAETFNRLQVFLCAQLWDDTVFPGSPDQVEIRVYSSNVPPGGIPLGEVERYYVEATITDDHGPSGPGERVDCGLLKIARDDEGFTYLYLAFRVNEGSASADTRYKVWDVQCDPVAVKADNANPWENQVELP